MTTVPHPAYSPDMAPCYSYVLPKMKLQLKGQGFVSIEEIQAESQQVLNTMKSADFNECFQKCQNRWDRCIQAQVDYFKGEGGNFGIKVSIHVITSRFSGILGSTTYTYGEHTTGSYIK
jgi:hypothetical protein